MTEPRYELLPAHLRAGMRRYVEQGIRPGSFLQALLEEDYPKLGAYMVNGPYTLQERDNILTFTETLPAEAWGTPAAVEAWIESKRPRP